MRSRSQFLASHSALPSGSIKDQTMTGSNSSWRQLSDVVAAVIGKIEPVPATARQDKKLGKATHSR